MDESIESYEFVEFNPPTRTNINSTAPINITAEGGANTTCQLRAISYSRAN